MLHQQEECYHQQEVFVQQEDIENKDQNTQQDVHQVLLVQLLELVHQVNVFNAQMEITVLEQLTQIHLDFAMLDTFVMVDLLFRLKT